MSWTDERVDMLRKLWTDGLSASQVAAELGGVTRNAVIGKVHRLGLSGRAKNPQLSASRQKRSTGRGASTYAKAGRPRNPSGNGSSANNFARQPPIVDLPKPVSLRIDLLQLNDVTCKWPEGDPQDAKFSFCGNKTRENDPYCEYHCRLAYQPAAERRSRAKPQMPQIRISPLPVIG